MERVCEPLTDGCRCHEVLNAIRACPIF